MKLFGIRPARQAGHRVELSKQPSDQLVGPLLLTELFELPEHARQRFIRIGDRAFGEVLALEREAFAVPEEFVAVEIGSKQGRSRWKPDGG